MLLQDVNAIATRNAIERINAIFFICLNFVTKPECPTYLLRTLVCFIILLIKFYLGIIFLYLITVNKFISKSNILSDVIKINTIILQTIINMTVMTVINPKIEESWKELLKDEFSKEYFAELKDFLVREKQQYAIYPPGNRIFAAFDYTPFSEVRVVILGQDPYHGPGQANGLCFSVADGIRKPPSLVNIFKELNADLDVPIPESGNLEHWAQQGVLLLNATLTVRARTAGSHQKKGWEIFTDSVIKTISDQKSNIVFILWGAYAQAKESLIDLTKHHVIKSAHPSPFSSHRGFFGSKPFSKTNAILRENGLRPINW